MEFCYSNVKFNWDGISYTLNPMEYRLLLKNCFYIWFVNSMEHFCIYVKYSTKTALSYEKPTFKVKTV